MRILLDENAPAGLKTILSDHDVCTVPEIGWAGISNGKLLDAAEQAGFQILITADANIKAQQRLDGRQIAMVVLDTTHWLTIRENAEPIIVACKSAEEGDYIVVNLPRRPLRRRPPPSVTSS
jgi:predicted nuclease of predicted toxin-antitoxin system